MFPLVHQQEIEKAWKMVDAAHEKETRARETIQSLKLEIANLSKLVEQGAGLTMGQEHRYYNLMQWIWPIRLYLSRQRWGCIVVNFCGALQGIANTFQFTGY